jgi:uncharacterized membrane-anchored protein
MSEEQLKQTATEVKAPEEEKKSEPNFWGISIGTLTTGLITLVSSVAGASPYGVIAVAVLAGVASLAGVLGYNYLIKQWNDKTDKEDMDKTGAAAGNTAVDLANQIGQINQSIDQMQSSNPPVPPSVNK